MESRPRRMLCALSATACCCTRATRMPPIIAAILELLRLDLVGGRGRDDDPFGAALARGFAITHLHALAFVRAQFRCLDRFRTLTDRGAALQDESLLPVGGLHDELRRLIVDLVERANERTLGWLLVKRRFGAIGRGMRAYDCRANRTRRRQNGKCNRQQEDSQPHAYSGFGLAIPRGASKSRKTVPANAAAGGVDRGVQPIATAPAGTDPEHNPGASTIGPR